MPISRQVLGKCLTPEHWQEVSTEPELLLGVQGGESEGRSDAHTQPALTLDLGHLIGPSDHFSSSED